MSLLKLGQRRNSRRNSWWRVINCNRVCKQKDVRLNYSTSCEVEMYEWKHWSENRIPSMWVLGAENSSRWERKTWEKSRLFYFFLLFSLWSKLCSGPLYFLPLNEWLCTCDMTELSSACFMTLLAGYEGNLVILNALRIEHQIFILRERKIYIPCVTGHTAAQDLTWHLLNCTIFLTFVITWHEEM